MWYLALYLDLVIWAWAYFSKLNTCPDFLLDLWISWCSLISHLASNCHFFSLLYNFEISWVFLAQSLHVLGEQRMLVKNRHYAVVFTHRGPSIYRGIIYVLCLVRSLDLSFAGAFRSSISCCSSIMSNCHSYLNIDTFIESNQSTLSYDINDII